jgi:hypothetical protein
MEEEKKVFLPAALCLCVRTIEEDKSVNAGALLW